MGSRAPLASKTHHLFLRIIAAVSQSSKPMTVADIAWTLHTPADVIGHCIGLHLYLEQKGRAGLTIPPPADYWVPTNTDVITSDLLAPQRAGRMMAVEAAIKGSIETDGEATVQ